MACLWIGAVTSALQSPRVTASMARSIESRAIRPYSADISPNRTTPEPPTSMNRSTAGAGPDRAWLPKSHTGMSIPSSALKTTSGPMPAGSPSVTARGLTGGVYRELGSWLLALGSGLWGELASASQEPRAKSQEPRPNSQLVFLEQILGPVFLDEKVGCAFAVHLEAATVVPLDAAADL